MNKVNWNVVAVAGVIGLLALMLGAGFLAGPRYGYGGWGMMGPWMMGPFMLGGMFFMWLIPLGFLVLAGLGIAWIARTAGGTNNFSAPAQSCPSCGRSVQADWKNCPHCGTVLAK